MPRPEPSWHDQLNAVRAWVAEHGSFPATNHASPAVRTLGAWWTTQRGFRSRNMLSRARRDALDDTLALARETRDEMGAEARSAAHRAAREKMQPAVLAMAREDIRAARAALKRPDRLLPGDAETLQLRIDHPAESRAELAVRAGITKQTYGRRLTKAVERGRTTRR